MSTPSSPPHRRLPTLVALAVAGTLALAGCGGEEEPAAESSPAASADSSPQEKQSERTKKTSPPEPVDEVVLQVTVTGNDVAPTAQQVELEVGQTLLLEVNSDRAGELHVHSSPEQVVNFEVGASRLDLSFDKPGSVDIEEHESGALIARVLVQ